MRTTKLVKRFVRTTQLLVVPSIISNQKLFLRALRKILIIYIFAALTTSRSQVVCQSFCLLVTKSSNLPIYLKNPASCPGKFGEATY